MALPHEDTKHPDATDGWPRGARKAVIAAVTGTVIEWYDYALYGAAAGVVIGPLFFSGDQSAGDLAAFATFAVGFGARPLGGVLIGHFGDRFGRRPAMLLTVLLMGVATVAVGLLPTYSQVGLLAPVLLVLFRLIQGFGAGAELAGAVTLVAEYAPRRRRGLITSLPLSCPPAGIALATFAFLGVSALGDDVLLGWAWRLPFLVSAVLFLVALYIRRSLEETPEYRAAMAEQPVERKLPAAEIFRHNKRALATGFLSITGHNALNYIMAVFAVGYLSSDAVGLGATQALLAVTISSLAAVVLSPVGGLLADRVGSRTMMIAGSIVGLALAFPLFNALSSGNFWQATAALLCGYAFAMSATGGSQGAFLTGLFPLDRRYSGVALTREINGAIVAGLTPLITAALIEAAGGGTLYAALYLVLCCGLSLVAVAVAPRPTQD
ncbi:MFS transporter [Georgenia alba]|uniref:MFS transporter n=1 Tax=Georgenia alba TaxID=2233858 RepID=A0ABW2QDC5_9MICO